MLIVDGEVDVLSHPVRVLGKRLAAEDITYKTAPHQLRGAAAPASQQQILESGVKEPGGSP